MFRPCYLFLLWNVILTYLAFCLTTVIAACFLHLCTCLTCSSIHASSLHPLLAHHHLCYVDVYCVLFCFCFLFVFLFLLYATFLHDSNLAWPMFCPIDELLYFDVFGRCLVEHTDCMINWPFYSNCIMPQEIPQSNVCLVIVPNRRSSIFHSIGNRNNNNLHVTDK